MSRKTFHFTVIAGNKPYWEKLACVASDRAEADMKFRALLAGENNRKVEAFVAGEMLAYHQDNNRYDYDFDYTIEDALRDAAYGYEADDIKCEDDDNGQAGEPTDAKVVDSGPNG